MQQEAIIQYESINAVRLFLSSNGLVLKTQRVHSIVEWGSDETDLHNIETDVLFIAEHSGWRIQIDELSEMHYEYIAYADTRYAVITMDTSDRLVIQDHHPKYGEYMVRISIS